MSAAANPAGTAATEVADRRQSLIIAARGLIAERGFEGLRVREVAQRVGINHATLHHYFPTKEILVTTVVSDTVRGLATFRAAQRSSALPARDALRAYLRAVRAHMRDDPTPFMVLSELFLRARRDRALAAMLQQLDEGWTGFFVTLVKRGQREGDFRRDLDAAAVARILTTYLRGIRLRIQDKGAALAREHAQLESWIAAAANDAPTTRRSRR